MFEAAADHIKVLGAGGQKVVIDAYSEGSRTRLMTVLAERGVNLRAAPDWQDVLTGEGAAAVVLGLPRGFVLPGRVAVLTEQDILGERVVRRHRPLPAGHLGTGQRGMG